MYTHLLSGYISANDVTRASGLWTEMQEEGVHPGDAFLEKLGEFLQENNQPIPFTIPSKVKPSARNTEKDVTKESETQGKDSSDKLKFLSAIRDGDIDAALELRKRYILPSVDPSTITELLILVWKAKEKLYPIKRYGN